ncbi:MAG: histidine phosphatase family protein [Deltaproteobacteria bacterium]|nr:histidine phosphatase family protein [Deltaproteobacteria bacterium]
MSLRTALLAGVVGAVLAPGAAQAQVVWVVRHAEKVDEGKDPDLSAQGHLRAERLGRALRDVPLTAVYVTHLKRTRQTAAAVLARGRWEPVTLPAGDVDGLVARIRGHRPGEQVFVVGHSDTLPRVWSALGCSRPLTLRHDEYDLLLRLDLDATPATRCTVLRQEN